MAETYVGEGPSSAWLKYDEQGRPYTVMANGKRKYISPVAVGGAPQEDTTSIFRSAPRWNPDSGEWDTPIDWGNILNLGTAAALTGGAASAFGALGGGAAMPALSSPASVLPAGAPSLLGGATTAATAFPALSAPASVLPAGSAGLMGAGAASGLPSWLGPVLSAAIPTLGRIGSGGGSGGGPGGGPGASPELASLLEEFMRRQAQGPLADAVTAQAQAGLPRIR